MLKNMLVALSVVLSLSCSSAVSAQETAPPTQETYHFDKHSEFAVFWYDFQLAVRHKDKAAIVKMMNFPFSNYDHSPMIFQNQDDFLAHYDELFDPEMVKLIENSRYRRGEADQSQVEDTVDPDGYVIEHENSDNGYNLVIEKVDDVYKLVRIAFYS